MAWPPNEWLIQVDWLRGRLSLSASQLDHSDSDCFGCAILSYGIEGRVYATDGMLPLDVLIVPFKGDKCPMLVGKPKLFFLQVWLCLSSNFSIIVYRNILSLRIACFCLKKKCFLPFSEFLWKHPDKGIYLDTMYNNGSIICRLSYNIQSPCGTNAPISFIMRH